MKKMVYSLLVCAWTCTSCVFVEEIDSVEDKKVQEQITEYINVPTSRSTDNAMVIGSGNSDYYTFDWAGNYQESMDEAVGGHESAWVYAYDGEGGQMKVTDGKPSVSYTQKGDWMDSGFRYAMADGDQLRMTGMQLGWLDAFAQVKFQIRNQLSSVHLQVRGIRLCHISTEGTFIFPMGGQNAAWVVGNQNRSLEYLSDTLQIAPDKAVMVPEEGTLPVIPQTSDAWTATIVPSWSPGTYVLVDCRIYSVINTDEGYREGTDYLIWGGDEGGFAEAAVPVALDALMGETSVLDITLDSSYNWFDISGSSPVKVLQPIVFAPSVEDWQNGGTTNIGV